MTNSQVDWGPSRCRSERFELSAHDCFSAFEDIIRSVAKPD